MLQETYNPTIQLFLRAGTKNGKPALLVSKWITNKEDIEEVVRRAENNESLNAILTISDKIRFYGGLSNVGIIKYDLETDRYYFNTEELN